MYAHALPWEENEDKKLLKEAADVDNIKTVVTPVHKMYAKVAKMALNQTRKLMVFDKTGTGRVLFYDLTDQEGKEGIAEQHSEETDICELLTNVKDFAVSAIENKVYVSGGYDMIDESPVNALIVFDGYTGDWRLLSAMKKNRCNHTMVQWRGGLLVTGGEVNSNKKITPTCEFYNPETDKWLMIEPLPEPRSCHACVIHKDSVFVSGGLGVPQHPQTSIWVYEQATSKWMSLDEDYPVLLPYKLAKHRMISHYDTIYIIGGVTRKESDHTKGLKPTARIISFKPDVSYLGIGALCDNIQRNKYDRVTPWSHDHRPLSDPLYNSAITRMGNNIAVMGGCSDKGRNSHLMTYDVEHNTLRTSKLTSIKYARGLPLNCDCVEVEKTSRTSLEQLVPRNWPLW